MATETVEYTLEALQISLKLIQHRDTLSHGTTIWPSARILSSLLSLLPLASIPRITAATRVLELGAGCGLAGLTAAACGAGRVVMTDLPAVVDWVLWNNLDRNRSVITHAADAVGAKGLGVEVLALDWLNASTPEASAVLDHQSWDLVIAADCIYSRALLPPFIDCLKRAASDRPALPDGAVEGMCRVVVASERRDTIVRDAFVKHAMEVGFEVTPVSRRIIKRLSDMNMAGKDGCDFDQIEIWILRLR